MRATLDHVRCVVLGWRPSGKALGGAGERIAARLLRGRGYRVLMRNVTLAQGEIDLVALGPDRRTIVLVEVKTRLAPAARSGTMRVTPEEAITRHKAHKLLTLAQALVKREGWSDRPIRIDVVGVDWDPRGRHAVRHSENAVTQSGR